MKAFITVIDDNGNVVCKNQLLEPVREEIVDLNPYQPPIKEARFSFVITQLADFQTLGAEFKGWEVKDESSN